MSTAHHQWSTAVRSLPCWRSLISCSLCLLALLLQVADARTIKLATTEFQPFSSPSLQDGGFETALIREAFITAGYQVQVDFFSWKRAYKMVAEGKYDILAGIYYTPQRNQHFAFSQPLYSLELGLVALKDLGVEQFDTLEDLQQYRIGVLAGTTVTPEFDHSAYLNKVIVHKEEVGIAMLYKKRLDLMAASFYHFKHQVMAAGRYNLEELVFLQPPLEVRPVHLAVSRALADHRQLLEDFHLGLARLKTSGAYDELLHRFDLTDFATDAEPPRF